MELWRDYRYTIISKSMEEDLQKFRHIMGAERYLEPATGSGLTNPMNGNSKRKRERHRAKNLRRKQKRNRRARRHRLDRGLQIGRAGEPARETGPRCFCRDDAATRPNSSRR